MWESWGGDILNGEHINNLVGVLAGDGSSVGVRISATLFFHNYVTCLQRIVVRQGSKNKKRSDKSIPAATNVDDPSWICPPRQAERLAGEGIPHAFAALYDSRGRQTCAECSPYLRRL